jgi:flagellar hook-length control protein FliK
LAPPAQPQSTLAGASRPSAAPAASLSVRPVASAGAAQPEPKASGTGKVTAIAKPFVAAIRATGPANAALSGAAARTGSNTVAPVTATRSGIPGSGKAAAATSAPEPAPGNSDADVARIVRLVATRLGKDHSVATLRLDPPELGSLRLRLDLRQEQLSLQIDAQTPAARRLLSERTDVLRRSLEAAGIQLERIEVRGPAMTDHAGRSDTPQQSDSWAHGQDGSARDPTGSAGGGPHPGTDSNPASPAAPLAREATVEPAAESLVNVLA